MINRILVNFDFKECTPAQYSITLRDLEEAGQAHPRGRVYHIAILKENSIAFTDVWESEETLQEFIKILFPILINNAVTPAQPTFQTIYNIISF
jgi:hypothetical protein